MFDQMTVDLDYQLDDRYARTRGRVYLSGTQALARIMLDQARRDQTAKLKTAGFVSGYRGSPLGALDQEMWRIQRKLDDNHITFMPAVNEDLGATAILGAQQAVLDPHCDVEGVFSMWYGKGPGVDRSGDALKHGNAYGSSKKGGVLVVAGDDHGCVSSSMPHQSDVAFMAWFMPTLSPASVEEYLEYGEYGFALSRFSGTWVGFKAISEIVESARSIDLKPDRGFKFPHIEVPSGGLHVRPADLPSPDIETRIQAKMRAVRAFAEANPIDRRIYDVDHARVGIVTSGKAHLDLMEALRLLGLDERKCRTLGVDVYKVGMVWPLARRNALRFVNGKQEVLVVEEKRGIIESQFKEYFYDWPGNKPHRMVGKYDEAGTPLVPWTGELSPLQLVPIIANRLGPLFPEERLAEKAAALTEQPPRLLSIKGATRTPYFCSGCPHNTSTKVPEGSTAASGIGCHVMASWMDRATVGYAQMGGEGVPHLVASKFNGGKHIFQNLGEGTWFHSGSLAVRQAVAAGANITYKILYNDAVAMTGGQPVDGPISVEAIAQSCRAEGVDRIAVMSDDIAKFNKADFPSGATFHDRSDLDIVQRALRDVTGVSVLIYEQTCATEKRRRRKRGEIAARDKFVVINDLVCEGCGDCSVQSNCLSVEPKETPLGRKRKINQSSCNADFSCVNGFCPSFVTVTGMRKQKTTTDLTPHDLVRDLPDPDFVGLQEPHNLLVTGVGGTGVITIGALISMAAHLEGKGATVLDFTGFAQKFGTVLGYIRLASSPEQLNQVRIDQRAADAVIGCDVVVSSAQKASQYFQRGTRMVLNRAQMPTGDLVLRRDASLAVKERETAIAHIIGRKNLAAFDANEMAETHLGDAVFSNVIMLGFAWQMGLVPVSLDALQRAIELNGVAVEKNLLAFALGRCRNAAPDRLPSQDTLQQPEPFDAFLARRMTYLEEYQDRNLAIAFRDRVNGLKTSVSAECARIAAYNLFRFLAVKDEFEVARLLTLKTFEAELDQEFEPGFRTSFHLAPPTLQNGGKDQEKKREFGPWVKPVLKVLSKMTWVRNTWLNPFRFHAETRLHRQILQWYDTVLTRAEEEFTQENEHIWLEVLTAGSEIRGFGHVRSQSWKDAEQVVQKAMALLK